MNYRHPYHAGNFADIVKHLLLTGLLNSLQRKETPLCYIDTHAGCGIYNLGASEAQKTLEFQGGVNRLRAATAPAPVPWVQQHLERIATLSAEKGGNWYPGSPWLAGRALRPQDRALMLELHPEDAHTLKRHMGRQHNVSVHERDAYEGLTALIPPREKRGLVLIDPPYEQERDDVPVTDLLVRARTKWPTGIYAIWFPIKHRAAVTRFYRHLRDTGIPKILTTELCILPADVPTRLNGSGLVIVNPPWQFDEDCRALLAWLTPVLSDHAGASWTVDWLAGETASGSS